MKQAVNIQGQRFGALVARLRTDSEAGKTRWVCECDCGEPMIARTDHLISGRVKRCYGCSEVRHMVRIEAWSYFVPVPRTANGNVAGFAIVQRGNDRLMTPTWIEAPQGQRGASPILVYSVLALADAGAIRMAAKDSTTARAWLRRNRDSIIEHHTLDETPVLQKWYEVTGEWRGAL